MRGHLPGFASAAALVIVLGAGAPALAQKSGGVLRVPHFDSPASMSVLEEATRATLLMWVDLLRKDVGEGFPENVTAFRPEMAVHGRFKLPCPVCGKPVQRIVYATNECNYCAKCQTNGRLLADRSLSRLLRESWPKSIDD